MTKPVEILAPAGSFDALTAAVRCGANAVYLGAGNFNARRHAGNFSENELKKAIDYCHVRNVSVYLTLNTLVTDAEIPELVELISRVCTFGADALIVQDLGVAKLVREISPDMPIHASTQMSVMNTEGIRVLESLGFRRAVLPRELSFPEIEEIRNNTDLELEVFVHGALCMSVSGQCYLSAMLGGRSGNRGLCAQPCRLPFEIPGGTRYDLSLKDLSLLSHLKELSDLGIESFKIEGRMKRPEYVAAAVSACKATLERVNRELRPSDLVDYRGVETTEEKRLREQLQAVFSRSGFTDGYYASKTGRSMFGTRQKENVIAAAPVLNELSRLYDKEPQTIPVSLSLTAEAGKPLMASASTGKETVFVTSDQKVQKAVNHPAEAARIKEQLHKTGGTPFKVQATDVKMDDNISLPVSEINGIRRLAIDALEKKLASGYEKTDYLKTAGITADDFATTALLELRTHVIARTVTNPNQEIPNIMVRFASPDQVPETFGEYRFNGGFGITSVIVPLFTPEDGFHKIKNLRLPFGVELPRALFGSVREVRNKLEEAVHCGASFAYCGTLDAVSLAKKAGLSIVGGPTLNITNSFSLAECEELGLHSVVLSTELDFPKINSLRSGIPRGIITYGRTPLMLTRNCPVKNGKNCRECNSRLYLTDRMGVRFPVTCRVNNGKASELLNSRPICLSDKQKDLRSLDFQMLYFTVETHDKVASVLSDFFEEKAPLYEFTRGLYYRGVE